jgi:hypothetical protein
MKAASALVLVPARQPMTIAATRNPETRLLID